MRVRQVLPEGLSRRRFLVAGALLAGSSVLAACASPSAPPTAVPPTAAAPTAAAGGPTATPYPGANVAAPTPGPDKPLTAPRLIDEPIPDALFFPMGSNAEMRFEDLANRGFGVPNSLFFVRNHDASVVVDPKTWKLSIEGDGIDAPFTLTYDELLKLPSTTVTRYIECAGNGRSFYQTFLNKPAQGGQWKLGGWGVAEWTGVALAEILDRAKVKKAAVEVLPIGLDKPRVRRPIPLSKALEADTLVVYAMNGEVLPIDHGFPARLLVPGWVGVNNVKWLGTLAVTTQPNWVDWNTGLYVMIGPDYQPQPPAKGPPVTQQVMKSAIALPWPANLKAGSQKITGYAWSPIGKIARVEVSADGGKTWMATNLVDPNVERAGVRWELVYEAKAGDTGLTPRATDDQGNVQPALAQQKWNQQGYLFGAAVPHPIAVS